jgi:hypothetical protein
VEAQIPDASFVQPRARFGAPTVGLGAGFGSIWSLTHDALVRIDPASNHVIGRLPLRSPFALAVGEGAVWAICCEAQVTVKRIDPSTMHVETFVRVGTSMKAFGVGDGFLWGIEFSEGGGMYRIDPTTAEVDDLRVGYNERFILPTPRWVWLIDSGSAQRVDPISGTLVDARAKTKASGSIGVAYSEGTVWLNAGTAVGFDAASGKVTARLPGFTGIKWWWTGGIAQLGRRIWVADPKGDRLLSLGLDR